MLILRDNWQGEFCVALFGGIGWMLVNRFVPAPVDAPRPQMQILDGIAPAWVWQFAFGAFAILQLLGLRDYNRFSLSFRLVGSTGLLLCFLNVFLAVLVASPSNSGLGAYAACICIELFAVIFHTSTVVRRKGR